MFLCTRRKDALRRFLPSILRQIELGIAATGVSILQRRLQFCLLRRLAFAGPRQFGTTETMQRLLPELRGKRGGLFRTGRAPLAAGSQARESECFSSR